MNALEVLRDSLYFFKRHLGSIVRLCLPLVIFEAFLQQVVDHASGPENISAISIVVGLLVYPLYTAALILFLDARSRGEAPRNRDLLAMAATLWPRFALLTALNTLLILLGLSLYRELGPVLTALLFIGRAGSSIAAELGLMRATDQIKALELMAIDPVAKAVAPRFWAAVLTVPLLTGVFCSLAISASYFEAVHLLGLDNGVFWSALRNSVDFWDDFGVAMLKSAIFGGTADMVALWFKDIGHETGFYWYVTACIACSLLVYLWMPDTRTTSLIDRDPD